MIVGTWKRQPLYSEAVFLVPADAHNGSFQLKGFRQLDFLESEISNKSYSSIYLSIIVIH